MPFRKLTFNFGEATVHGKEFYHRKHKKLTLIPSVTQEKVNDSEVEFDLNSEAIFPLDLELPNSMQIREREGI